MSTRKPRGRIRRIFWLLAAVAMIVAVMPLAGAAAHAEDDPFVVDLIADGGSDATAVDVGDVEVWNDAHYLYVDYKIDTTLDDAWCLTKTHLAVDVDWELLPQTKKHNPIPGQFEYTADHDCVTEYGYEIPMTWNVDVPLAIAAHAEVEIPGGLGALEVALPYQVSMVVAHPGASSYFDTTVMGGTILDGTYAAYCIDTDRTINPGTTYTANVYSSYETLPDGTVEFPESLDLVNWIINQGFVGTDAGDSLGFYTYGDVQRAIWALIEDGQSTSGLGPWSPARVAKIVGAAQESGEGFEPGCGDAVAVILVPVNGKQITIAQVTFANVEVPCETREETAWGDGERFGKQWGMWFDYTVQEVLIETIEVSSDGSVVSSAPLMDGVSYELRASGTYVYLPGWNPAGIADAQCSYRVVNGELVWVNGADLDVLYPGYESWLEVWVDSDPFDWDPTTCETTDHFYTGSATGENSSIDFNILDSYYGDNSGSIWVEIWWMGNN